MLNMKYKDTCIFGLDAILQLGYSEENVVSLL